MKLHLVFGGHDKNHRSTVKNSLKRLRKKGIAMIANCIVLTKGFILCIVQVTVVLHSVIYHYYACTTHALNMSYGFVTILVEKLHYITATLRKDTLPFFDSYRSLLLMPIHNNLWTARSNPVRK